MLDDYLVDECELIATTTNDFGDEVEGVTQVLACRWRDSTLIRRGSHSETSDATSLVHFAADAPVKRGSVLKFNGEYYKVDEYLPAKRLGETEPVFKKCGVTITSLGVS